MMALGLAQVDRAWAYMKARLGKTFHIVILHMQNESVLVLPLTEEALATLVHWLVLLLSIGQKEMAEKPHVFGALPKLFNKGHDQFCSKDDKTDLNNHPSQ